MQKNEISMKENRLFSFLEYFNKDGVLISRRDNFAWTTCGGFSGINKFIQEGVADLLIFQNKKYLITSNIEIHRFDDEEVCGQGYELVDYNWYKSKDTTIRSLIENKRVASDTGFLKTENLSRQLKKLRYSLVEEEIERLRELSQLSAKAMSEVCNEVKEGDTEFEIAANLTWKLMKYGAHVPVCLVAADERIEKYRHPIPTDKHVKNYVMIVLCAEKKGLIVSMTRLVSFTALPQELVEKHNACMRIDAVFINNTRTGMKVSDIFNKGIKMYEECGYPYEWKYHHQGGSAGYEGRDYVATFDTKEKVEENQMFAWNPSITGTKSEDTILVTKDGQEILTEIADWPMKEIQIENRTIRRPDILIV